MLTTNKRQLTPSAYLQNVSTHLLIKMRLKNSIIFAILYSIVGLLIGVDIINKMNKSYHLFIIVLPIAFYITSIILWKYVVDKQILILKNEPKQSKIIFTGFLIGIISHPISFLLMLILSNIIYWIPFINSYDLINEPSSFEDILFAPFIGTFFSLIMYGWITIPSAIIIAIFISHLNNINKNKNQNI